MYQATAQFHCLQQARDLRGSTCQTIDNVNEWHSRGKNQGHLPLSQVNAYHPWRRTKPICSVHRQLWHSDHVIKYQQRYHEGWKFDCQGRQSTHLCHQSSYTICKYFHNLTLWNRRDPHTSEMQPCLPPFLKEFKDKDSAKYSWLRVARKCLLSCGRLLKYKWLVATKNDVVT